MPAPRRRRGYLPADSEAAFQVGVIQCARFGGWQVWAPPPNRPGPSGRVPKIIGVTAGWPDLAFWRVTPAAEIFWAELKGAKTRVRPEQTIVLDQLRACGLEVYLWRPADWPQIEARLLRDHPGRRSHAT